MHNHIRAIRKQQSLTLAELAARCSPETTAQTIGRLETGTRTLSLAWLERIAKALNVNSDALLARSEEQPLTLTAIVGVSGAEAPGRTDYLPVFRPSADQLAVQFTTSIGDYRSGDIISLDRLEMKELTQGLNRDILLPRPGGRFIFGRMLDIGDGKVQILPLISGGRQIVVQIPEWIGVATHLIRNL